MKKRNVNDINLKIEKVKVIKNHILFCWSADIGWGEYSVYYSEIDNEWKADTEFTDSNDDKTFGKKLFDLLMEKVNVIH